MTKVEFYAPAKNTRACDIFGNRFQFDAFSTVFMHDRPHLKRKKHTDRIKYDLYAFSFLPTFKSVFKLMRFP